MCEGGQYETVLPDGSLARITRHREPKASYQPAWYTVTLTREGITKQVGSAQYLKRAKVLAEGLNT